MTWVLTHPRNLVSQSMTDGISAYAGEFGGCKVKRDRGQVEGVVVGSADDFDKVFRVARGAGP